MKISVIGLGKLGLPLATTIASKGFQVIGVDINKKVIEDVNNGCTSLQEPNLLALIKKYKYNLSATFDVKEAVLETEITFIITPTPSQKNGYFSLKYVNDAAREVASALKVKQGYHLVVVVSTVMPESTEKIKTILEKDSGKKCIEDFGLCYNPEFIALGSVIYNLLNPDFILIGESDKKAGDILQKFYEKYCDNEPAIARMNFVNAELAKISVNTYVTTKISYANMLSGICEKLPGGDVDVVTQAIGLDSRIGKKYLKGGTAFGGPCFPRDNIAFVSLSRNLRVASYLAKATHRMNLRQIDRLTEIVLQYKDDNSTVGILGLSYKPFTDVIEESPGFLLAQQLIKKNITVCLWDPLALDNAERSLGKSARYAGSVKECIENSQVLVITTEWSEYKNINSSWFEGKPKVIIDPWRILSSKQLTEKVKYLPLGTNSG